MAKTIRLQKYLADCGVASRRKSEVLITEGRVAVNNRVTTTLGTKVDAERDRITLDGKRVSYRYRRHYLMMNKPKGTLTTLSDPEGRPTVATLLPPSRSRLFPVGRLDWSSEGLLLFTDDGDLAHRAMHPSSGLEKTYLVRVRGEVQMNSAALDELRAGIELEDGPAVPTSVRLHRSGAKSSWLFISVTEGRNRLVRRLMDAVEHPVIRLKRIQYGPISLGTLASGASRWLQPAEVEELMGAVGLRFDPKRLPSPSRSDEGKRRAVKRKRTTGKSGSAPRARSRNARAETSAPRGRNAKPQSEPSQKKGASERARKPPRKR